MFVDLMNDVYHTFTERFLRAQISFGGPPMDFEGDGESRGSDGQARSAPPSQGSRPTQRYNEFGLLEDVSELETNGAEAEAAEVVEIGPAEPPIRKKAARPEPIVTGAGRVRSLNPVAQAGVPGVSPSAVAADWTNVGRNDPCPCGSGKKFKKCHGANA